VQIRSIEGADAASPHRYVLRQPVARETELLRETDRALAGIALEVGFADPEPLQPHLRRDHWRDAERLSAQASLTATRFLSVGARRARNVGESGKPRVKPDIRRDHFT
jgi:hypothetical protein